jgi:DNA-binding MarR family transcriptional regulator
VVNEFVFALGEHDRCTVTTMDAQPNDIDPVVAIERAISELRRTGNRWRAGPGMWTPPPASGAESPTSGHRGPFGWKSARHEHPFANMARYRLLSMLDRLGDGASVSELATAIGVDQPRASRVVSDCVDRGLVTKETDPTDARRSVIALTDDGRAVLDERRRERRAAVEDALEGFTPAERAQLAELLARFVAGGRES